MNSTVEAVESEEILVAEPETERTEPTAVPRSRVTIAGPGRLGQALGRLLREAGYPVHCVAARRLSAARRAVEFIGGGTPCRLDDPALAEADITLVCVADGAIAPLAVRWSRWIHAWRGKVVLHTSGALPAAVLEPLRRYGAAVGSLHPFQTIPSAAAGYRNLPHGFWAIEGQGRARAAARAIVQSLGGLSFPVEAAQKTLYHAGAVMACGAVVALLDQSHQLLRCAGVPAKNIRPMLGHFVSETLRNFVSLGGRGALTGPATRGDWDTVREHVRAIKRHAPGVLPVYGELLRAMAKLAGRKLPRGLLA
jgi:predicted short-subunit dehydrogenase-like oxidoreductase (DUF2520 family)